MSDAFSHILGHARAVHRLRAMLMNEAVPQAIVFHGPRRVGKATLASALAAALLSSEDPARHPDFRLVERPRDEKTGKLKKSIPIEAVRGLQEHLRLSAFLGGAKVAVIDGAEAMSEEAANALLKTLEEPAARAHVVLCVETLARLPKTIVSRAACLELRRLPEAELSAALSARGMAVETAARAAALADGKPGAAAKADMVDWYETEERRWIALRSAPIHRRFALLADLAPPRADREETILMIRDTLDVWQVFLRKELKADVPSADARVKTLRVHAASNLRRLIALKTSLDANVQPRLLLERFALTLDR